MARLHVLDRDPATARRAPPVPTPPRQRRKTEHVGRPDRHRGRFPLRRSRLSRLSSSRRAGHRPRGGLLARPPPSPSPSGRALVVPVRQSTHVGPSLPWPRMLFVSASASGVPISKKRRSATYPPSQPCSASLLQT